MLELKDLEKIWSNLPEAVKLDILAYATALTRETQTVTQKQRILLTQRLENYKKQESAISWGHIYNQLLEELI